jgi:hypothetical protein
LDDWFHGKAAYSEDGRPSNLLIFDSINSADKDEHRTKKIRGDVDQQHYLLFASLICSLRFDSLLAESSLARAVSNSPNCRSSGGECGISLIARFCIRIAFSKSPIA